jgi:hypothetical protein
MTRRSDANRDDRHGRFAAWLLAAAEEDPPRDLAVHASLCSECQLEIAAFDMLTGIDLGLAGMPPPRALTGRSRLHTARRVAVAVSGAAAMAAIGVGGWRLAEAGGLGAGPASEPPTQAVLGNTGHPESPPAASRSAGNPATSQESAGSSPSPSAGASAGASASGGLVPLPPPPPAVTPRPAATPSKTPRPSIIIATPTPVPTPAVTSSPDPTPEPTAEPTASAAEAA